MLNTNKKHNYKQTINKQKTNKNTNKNSKIGKISEINVCIKFVFIYFLGKA